MKKGTIEQIDYLRDKAGLSYEEAVNMLEQYDGDLTKCMIELERVGRIRSERGATYGDPGRSKPRGAAFVLDWDGIKRVLFSRVAVRKGDLLVTNLTVASWAFVLLAAPWVVVIGVVGTFLTGCKIKWEKTAKEPDFNIHNIVGNAAENIRRTADSVASAVKSQDAPIAPKVDETEENDPQ